MVQELREDEEVEIESYLCLGSLWFFSKMPHRL